MPRGVASPTAVVQTALFPDAVGVSDCLDLVNNQLNELELVLTRLNDMKTKLESMQGVGLLFVAKVASSKSVYTGLDLTVKI